NQCRPHLRDRFCGRQRARGLGGSAGRRCRWRHRSFISGEIPGDLPHRRHRRRLERDPGGLVRRATARSARCRGQILCPLDRRLHHLCSDGGDADRAAARVVRARGRAMSAANPSATTRRLAAHLHRRARWRWPEIVFWLAILAAIFAVPSRAALINEILIAGLFALSLDLILGLTGVVSLGHAAFLGLGAYAAAILASKGFADPTLGLVFGASVAALIGLI